MLGQLDKFTKANPEFSVLVIASMGQEAIEHEPVTNQLIIGDFDAFMASLGFEPSEYNKLTGMEPEYVVGFTKVRGLNVLSKYAKTWILTASCQQLNP